MIYILNKYFSLKSLENIEHKPYNATIHKNKSARNGPVTKAKGISINTELTKFRNDFM